MRTHLTIFWLFTSVFLGAQNEKYCSELQQDFNNAISTQNIAAIDFYFHKMAWFCGASEEQIGAVNTIFQQKGYALHWTNEPHFYIKKYPQAQVDTILYYGMYTFDELDPSHSLRLKYKNEQQYIARRVKKDQKKYKNEEQQQFSIAIIPHYEVAIYSDNWSEQIVDMYSLKTIPREVFERDEQVAYQGGGIFTVTTEDSVRVMKLQTLGKTKQLTTIVTTNGTIKVIPVTTTQSYILVENEPFVQLYDEQGIARFDSCSSIVHNPFSNTMIVCKDAKARLYDMHLNGMFEKGKYMEEKRKDDTVVYKVLLENNRQVVCNAKGEIIIGENDVDKIEIQEGPYALVMKNGKVGVIDFVTKEILIEILYEEIKPLQLGLFACYKENSWVIKDEKNQALSAPFFCKEIKIMKLRNEKFVITVHENKKLGLCIWSGEQLLAPTYDKIQYSYYSKGKIEAWEGETRILIDEKSASLMGK